MLDRRAAAPQGRGGKQKGPKDGGRRPSALLTTRKTFALPASDYRNRPSATASSKRARRAASSAIATALAASRADVWASMTSRFVLAPSSYEIGRASRR